MCCLFCKHYAMGLLTDERGGRQNIVKLCTRDFESTNTLYSNNQKYLGEAINCEHFEIAEINEGDEEDDIEGDCGEI